MEMILRRSHFITHRQSRSLPLFNKYKHNSGNLRPTPRSSVNSLLILSKAMLFGPLSTSLAPQVKSSRTLLKWITPIANWYANASGYRKYGFKYDDLRPFFSRVLRLSCSYTSHMQFVKKILKYKEYAHLRVYDLQSSCNSHFRRPFPV